MAKSGQRSSHCIQAMQASALATLTTKASISRTFVGQNSAQMLHPLQYFSMISISAFALIRVFLLYSCYVVLIGALTKRRDIIISGECTPTKMYTLMSRIYNAVQSKE
jgi:hypothetical protein